MYPEDDPIGDQRRLQIFRDDDGIWAPLSSVVNAYTNRISATVEAIENAEFRVLYGP